MEVRKGDYDTASIDAQSQCILSAYLPDEKQAFKLLEEAAEKSNELVCEHKLSKRLTYSGIVRIIFDLW